MFYFSILCIYVVLLASTMFSSHNYFSWYDFLFDLLTLSEYAFASSSSSFQLQYSSSYFPMFNMVAIIFQNKFVGYVMYIFLSSMIFFWNHYFLHIVSPYLSLPTSFYSTLHYFSNVVFFITDKVILFFRVFI